MADDHYVPTRRGTDERLETANRQGADQRLAAKKARRSHDRYDEFDAELDSARAEDDG
jgi:GTP-binding protein